MQGRHILEMNGVRGSVAVGCTQSHFGVGELRQSPLSSRAGDAREDWPPNMAETTRFSCLCFSVFLTFDCNI